MRRSGAKFTFLVSLGGPEVAGATVILLFLMTGSVVLPVKTVVMNLPTLSAAFCVLVLIF